jgi:hypothetical protein
MDCLPQAIYRFPANSPFYYCSFAYSALASFRMGMSGSASFQRAKEVVSAVLIAKTSDPDTLQFARSTLQITGQDYEMSASDEMKASGQSSFVFLQASMNRPDQDRKSPTNLAGVVDVINKDQDLDYVAAAFLAFREMTGEKAKMFDFAAVNRWCSSHEPKCK